MGKRHRRGLVNTNGNGNSQLVIPKPRKVFATLEEELAAAKADYETIVNAVVSGIRVAVYHFRRLKVSNYSFDVYAQCLKNHLPPKDFVDRAIRTYDKLKPLVLTNDENCSSIFAHRFFIMAVYEYPEFIHVIAFILMYFLRDSTQRHRNILVADKLCQLMTAVLQKKTIYDEFLLPNLNDASVRYHEQISRDFCQIKEIRSDHLLLKWKLAARHLNTATFMTYFVIIMNHSTYTEQLSALIAHMTFSMSDENFLAVSRIFEISHGLIHFKAGLLTNSICRMSRFLDKIVKNDDKYWKYKMLLKGILLNQSMEYNLIFRDKERIMIQVGLLPPGEQRKSYCKNENNRNEIVKPIDKIPILMKAPKPWFMKNPLSSTVMEELEMFEESVFVDNNKSLKPKITSGKFQSQLDRLFGPKVKVDVGSGDCRIIDEVKKLTAQEEIGKNPLQAIPADGKENDENLEFVDALDLTFENDEEDDEFLEFKDPEDEDVEGESSFVADVVDKDDGEDLDAGDGAEDEEDYIEYDDENESQTFYSFSGQGLGGDDDQELEFYDPQELITEDANYNVEFSN